MDCVETGPLIEMILVLYLIEYTPSTGADMDTDSRCYIIDETCAGRVPGY